MRQTADHEGVGHIGAGRDPDAPVVEEGALALLGDEHFVLGGIVDHPRDDLALPLETDRDAELRQAVQEVGGAVEGIDVPAVGLVRALDDPALLHDEAVAGPRLLQSLAQDGLGLAVRRRDEIARTFARHLKVLDLAEIALQRARRLHHGVGHDGHQGRADHRYPRSWGAGWGKRRRPLLTMRWAGRQANARGGMRQGGGAFRLSIRAPLLPEPFWVRSALSG